MDTASRRPSVQISNSAYEKVTRLSARLNRSRSNVLEFVLTQFTEEEIVHLIGESSFPITKRGRKPRAKAA